MTVRELLNEIITHAPNLDANISITKLLEDEVSCEGFEITYFDGMSEDDFCIELKQIY